MATRPLREDLAADRPGPLDFPPTSTRAALKRTVREFMDDDLTDLAAALTYYGFLAMFPTMLALVALLGLAGESATDELLDNISELAPGPARDILVSAVENLRGSTESASVLLFVGLGVALWSASGYVAAFMRASNKIYELEEGRPLPKALGVRVAITVVLLLLLATIALSVGLTGPIARDVGDVVGVGDTAVDVWSIAKWPALLALATLLFAFLYWAAPNAKQPGFRWISAGGILGVAVWVIASLGFAFYVSNFGSYNATYGAIGGVIVFLIWLWLSNVALLLGAELNAELERGRRIDSGDARPGEEPFVELRDASKLER
jgi:membrane protein